MKKICCTTQYTEYQQAVVLENYYKIIKIDFKYFHHKICTYVKIYIYTKLIKAFHNYLYFKVYQIYLKFACQDKKLNAIEFVTRYK